MKCKERERNRDRCVDAEVERERKPTYFNILNAYNLNYKTIVGFYEIK